MRRAPWTRSIDALTSPVLGIFVALALYRLFKEVDRGLAILMVILGAFMVTPIYFVNTLNDAGTLLRARCEFCDGRICFGATGYAMVMLFLNLHHYGAIVNEMFWGLWLIPLGVLTYRSGFLPRFLGICLILNAFAYLAQNITGILWPQYLDAVANAAFPVQFGEVAFMLWLLIMGARQPRVAALATP